MLSSRVTKPLARRVSLRGSRIAPTNVRSSVSAFAGAVTLGGAGRLAKMEEILVADAGARAMKPRNTFPSAFVAAKTGIGLVVTLTDLVVKGSEKKGSVGTPRKVVELNAVV